MPYEFTPEGFNQFSEDVLKAEGDQATLTTLLADMQGTITEAIAKDRVNQQTVDTVTAENTRLRAANMTLFLRVGADARDGDKEQPNEQEEEKPMDTADYMREYFNRESAAQKK